MWPALLSALSLCGPHSPASSIAPLAALQGGSAHGTAQDGGRLPLLALPDAGTMRGGACLLPLLLPAPAMMLVQAQVTPPALMPHDPHLHCPPLQRHAHARAVLEASVGRISQRLVASAWDAWQQHVMDQRVACHRVAVCQRRHQANLLRAAFAGWQQRAALAGAERQIVAQCQRRANRNRMAAALAAFRASAEEAAVCRSRERQAASWYAGRLQARAFAALAGAVAARREFERRLAGVAGAVQQGQLQEAFGGWRTAAALSTAETQLVAAAQRWVSYAGSKGVVL